MCKATPTNQSNTSIGQAGGLRLEGIHSVHLVLSGTATFGVVASSSSVISNGRKWAAGPHPASLSPPRPLLCTNLCLSSCPSGKAVRAGRPSGPLGGPSGTLEPRAALVQYCIHPNIHIVV